MKKYKSAPKVPTKKEKGRGKQTPDLRPKAFLKRILNEEQIRMIYLIPIRNTPGSHETVQAGEGLRKIRNKR